MKAILALVIIYVGTFFAVIQGASQNPVQAAPQNTAAAQEQSGEARPKPIDPAKEADIRALMELVGARDAVQDAADNATEQYREKLLAAVPNNDRGQAFVNTFIGNYQKKFDADQVAEQLVGIYDKHFTEDDIKGLLQFYGSPLGQKVSEEMPKIGREIQAASRAASAKAAKEALEAAKEQNPGVGQSARLGFGRRQGRTQQDASQQVSQQQNPQ
jgi:hypothetical protein